MPFETHIAGDGISGATPGGCFEAQAATVRSADREAAEKVFAPERQRAEQQRIQLEKEKADRANQRLAERLARACQDEIDIKAGTLVITPDGFRARRNIISGRWEPDQRL